MDKITLVLADDHPIFHEGLRVLLEAEPDFTVIGKANDGLNTLRLIEKLQPDVLLVDMAMPNMNGLEVTRQIKKRFPQVQIVILSMHANEGYVVEALNSGASGYILKESSFNEVIKGIREVHGGRRFLSSSFSQQTIDTYLERAKTGPVDPYDTLTAREREMQMTAESQSSAEVGRRLFISPRTVEIHRQNATQVGSAQPKKPHSLCIEKRHPAKPLKLTPPQQLRLFLSQNLSFSAQHDPPKLRSCTYSYQPGATVRLVSDNSEDLIPPVAFTSAIYWNAQLKKK
jgi:DNA-binding NarL/FixJ family response regulator